MAKLLAFQAAGYGRHNDKLRRDQMSDEELEAILRAEIRGATGYIDTQITDQRRKALRYYLGEPFGEGIEQEGQSQVVSMDVQDTIEGMMPDFVEIFLSGEATVNFLPGSDAEADRAELQTDYANYIYNHLNDGYDIGITWFRDGLLQKMGTLKVWYDDTPRHQQETLTNVSTYAWQKYTFDPEVEILEETPREATEEEAEFTTGDNILWDLTIQRTEERGVVIWNVPPEQFLISERAESLDDARFLAAKRRTTVGELIEEGYDEDIVMSLPTHDEFDYTEEHNQRFSEENRRPDTPHYLDAASREVWIHEAYMKIDYEGTGVPVWREVIAGGSGRTILANTEVDDHPFVSWTPIPVPHRWLGRSVADLVMEVQLVKSVILRNGMDNLYNLNNARTLISRKVDEDDFATKIPSMGIRVNSDNVEGHTKELMTVPILNEHLQMLDRWDQIREVRTGEARASTAMDPEALHKTHAGAELQLGQAQRRKLLIARNIASAYEKLFRKINALVVRNMDKPQMARIGGKDVVIDPQNDDSPWKSEMMTKIAVGLGHGTKTQSIAQAKGLLDAQVAAMQFQGGQPDGPILSMKKLFNGVKNFTETLGFNPDLFWENPQGREHMVPQQGEQADPAVEALKMQAQVEQMKEQGRDQREKAKMQMEDGREREKMASEAERTMADLQAKLAMQEKEFTEKLILQREESEAQIALKQWEMEQEMAMKREELGLEAVKIETEAETARIKADLDAQAKDADTRSKEAIETLKATQPPSEGQEKGNKSPTVVEVKVDAPKQARRFKINRDADGNISGAEADDVG